MSALRRIALCAAVLATAALADAADAPQKAAPAAQPVAPKAEPPATPAATDIKTEGEKVKLPVFTVSAERLRQIDVTIKKLEKQISREKKQLEKSNLDEALNSEKVARAAAIFGGKSTVQRASVAAVRIESMEKELQLLETLRTPLTKDDRAMIEQLVEDQRTYRRNLDEALR